MDKRPEFTNVGTKGHYDHERERGIMIIGAGLGGNIQAIAREQILISRLRASGYVTPVISDAIRSMEKKSYSCEITTPTANGDINGKSVDSFYLDDLIGNPPFMIQTVPTLDCHVENTNKVNKPYWRRERW